MITGIRILDKDMKGKCINTLSQNRMEKIISFLGRGMSSYNIMIGKLSLHFLWSSQGLNSLLTVLWGGLMASFQSLHPASQPVSLSADQLTKDCTQIRWPTYTPSSTPMPTLDKHTLLCLSPNSVGLSMFSPWLVHISLEFMTQFSAFSPFSIINQN